MDADQRVVLLLGDIGVHGFKDLFTKYPDRCFNIGILEQATMSVAAGLSMAGLIPIIHSIAPFIVERCYEQIKDDFGYQGLVGNIVSVGASYDYAALGCTHHCPADVAILSNIPGMHIFVPGHKDEFDKQLKENYWKGLNYYRISEKQNKTPLTNSGVRIKPETKGLVVAVGPMADITAKAVEDLPVDIAYFSENIQNLPRNAFYVEPYYSEKIGVNVPKKFMKNYGTLDEHNEALGFTVGNIKQRVKEFYNIL